jgi:hypothetical protein
MNGLTREDWVKLKEVGAFEPGPERFCLVCHQLVGPIAYPVDPGERGVLCVRCWRKRLFTPSGTHASRGTQNDI